MFEESSSASSEAFEDGGHAINNKTNRSRKMKNKRKKRDELNGRMSCWSVPFVKRETFDQITGIASGEIELDLNDKKGLNNAWIGLLNVMDSLERAGHRVKNIAIRDIVWLAAKNADDHAGMSERGVVAEMIMSLYRSLRDYCKKESIVVLEDDGPIMWEDLDDDNFGLEV